MLRIVINYEVEETLFLKAINELLSDLKIISFSSGYQLLEFFEADSNIVKRINYLNHKEDIFNKKGFLDKKILEFEKINQIFYDEKQKEAIKNAFLKNFLIIAGGPGTGKTTIISSIVALYKDIFKKEDLDLE